MLLWEDIISGINFKNWALKLIRGNYVCEFATQLFQVEKGHCARFKLLSQIIQTEDLVFRIFLDVHYQNFDTIWNFLGSAHITNIKKKINNEFPFKKVELALKSMLTFISNSTKNVNLKWKWFNAAFLFKFYFFLFKSFTLNKLSVT